MVQQIIIADDHPLFRAALRQAVSEAVPDAQMIEVDSIKTLQASIVEHPDADLVLLDLNMPGAHGFSGLVFMRGQYPGLPVVVVSGSEELQVMRRSIDYGASGFIPKSAPLPTITAAIQDVLDGEVWLPPGVADKIDRMHADVTDFSDKLASLTPQQFRVLGMLAEGLLNKQIAYDLDVSEATVKAHITAVFRKLGVRNRTQAVIAIQQMEIDPSDTSLSGS
ncbi:MAG: DNA-binding response regulator [Alteromonadaceae bacterium]|uniref:LuxR C-terminal-related transcriptional regulator n=1 Tax=unclassified Marinobacter TaxID=83889 RepID=UPI000C523241|nr:response regulator transcription factor [Marinobacter sp. BGYM27]MAA63610.1 DNA-binding response regulator [Alteromonadaceae bacterium]MBH84495.1 DNA-binding response regulator [Alteromonadaceae bacterium]MDG5498309.1 response regulator transcription factor [Marinobacter sp. BGYM27]|tara:strand:- start:5291 stop:5956 length:666 start_codon:yes stop_codon:yes gene_type:complete